MSRLADIWKALRPGGRTSPGYTPEQIAAERAYAQQLLVEERVAFTSVMEVAFTRYADQVGEWRAAYRTADHSGKWKITRAWNLERARLQRQLRHLIRTYYRQQMWLGKRAAGNLLIADRAERRVQERLRRDEYAYAENFIRDIDAGKGTMDYRARAGLYGNALDEARWFGVVYADQSPGRYLRWRNHPAEHCCDCLFLSGRGGWGPLAPDVDDTKQHAALKANRRAAFVRSGMRPGGRWGNGVYTAQELAIMGIVPQSGKLLCTTNCKCELREVAKPPGRPMGLRAKEVFPSLAPKVRWKGRAWQTKRKLEGRVKRAKMKREPRRGA